MTAGCHIHTPNPARRAETAMKHDTVTLIDEHTVVACSITDAAAHLSAPATVAAWFGARYRPDRTTVDIDDTTLQFCHQWAGPEIVESC